jgi:hypothetical protein
MTTNVSTAAARPGDWIVARGVGDRPARRGEIVEVLGKPGHEHFRIRWDEEHETIFYPADGVTVERHPHGAVGRDRSVTRRS